MMLDNIELSSILGLLFIEKSVKCNKWGKVKLFYDSIDIRQTIL